MILLGWVLGMLLGVGDGIGEGVGVGVGIGICVHLNPYMSNKLIRTLFCANYNTGLQSGN